MADYFFSLHRSSTWGRRRACRRIWYAHNFGDACVWTSKMWGRDDTFVAYMHAYLDASMAHINPLLSIACTEQTLRGAFRLIKIYAEDYMRMQLTGDCEACWSLHSFGIKRRNPRILHQSTRSQINACCNALHFLLCMLWTCNRSSEERSGALFNGRTWRGCRVLHLFGRATQCCLCTSTASHITNLQQVVGGVIWNPIYQEDTPLGEHPGAPSLGEDLETSPRLAPTRMRISMLLGIAHAAYLLPCRSRCPWGSVSELHPLGKDSGTSFLDALSL